MGKDSKQSSGSSRSFGRLLLWEALGFAGFLHILQTPLTDSFWSMNFYYNALFFLAAYPLLYVYRWKWTDGCLGTLLWPLSFLLSWGLGVSAYLWIAYVFYFTLNPYYQLMIHHEVVLGFLFLFLYFPLIQPIWGIGKKYFSLGKLIWILLFAALGGFLGFLLGQFLTKKLSPSLGGDTSQFLLWLALIFLGAAAGAVAARRGGKE